jgi:hypothetical protein
MNDMKGFVTFFELIGLPHVNFDDWFSRLCLICVIMAWLNFAKASFCTKSFLKFSMIKIRTKMAIRATSLLITGMAGRF